MITQVLLMYFYLRFSATASTYIWQHLRGCQHTWAQWSQYAVDSQPVSSDAVPGRQCHYYGFCTATDGSGQHSCILQDLGPRHSVQTTIFIHTSNVIWCKSQSVFLALCSVNYSIGYFQDDGPLSRRLGARISPYIILLILRKCCLHMDQEFKFLMFNNQIFLYPIGFLVSTL